jgi:dipeptidyl aminopeptidase/acylaminoacyl peptidase
MTKTRPYGEWPSPITTDLIVSKSISLGNPLRTDQGLLWTEGRPREGGRYVLVLKNSNGEEIDLTPAPFNVRTRVHEYGGGAWLVHRGHVYFSNFADQQIYCVALTGGEPRQLTQSQHLRFADGCVDAARNRIIYVIEDHVSGGSEPQNYLGAVDLASGDVTPLTQGHDFYSSPTVNPNGSQLAWITWDHPNMPWDDTALWCSEIKDTGDLNEPNCIVNAAAVQQPRFDAGGRLHFIADTSGWWNLYRSHNETVENLCPMAAEFGGPPWGFGMSSYRFRGDGTIVCVYGIANISHLSILKPDGLHDLDLPFTAIDGIQFYDDRLSFVAASPTAFSSIIDYDLAARQFEIVKCSNSLEFDPADISVPEAISFVTGNGETAHAFYYPPANQKFTGPTEAKPPLLVILHGGPTGATGSSLSLGSQFWTSRGFALLDVNYRGSTGYGREYRNRLRNNWGIIDVEDTVAGTDCLIRDGRVDEDKLAITGGSAGGYTTLCALTFSDTFKAGASHYGVGDLEALAKDTHKFESRYLDSLIGKYPEEIEVYHARSPIKHTDRLLSATIFFQGLEDKIVPPNQAEMMVQALTDNGIPVAYVPFEGEQHGFRKAENIKRSLDLELYFYGRIFGFIPADDIEPISITNLDT